MNLYEKILVESAKVNAFWKEFKGENFTKIVLDFGKYRLKVEENFAEQNFPLNSFFLIDKNLNLATKNFLRLESSESKTKNIDFIENLIHKRKENFLGSTIVAVGGGVILDTALSIASLLNLKVVLVPTTILSMSDSAIGSKARANKLEVFNGKEVFIKHFYRAMYDPQEIHICENFLQTLPEKLIGFSCAEMLKHAFFQSNTFLEFLLSKDFSPFDNKKSLLKAILWSADLKRICMQVDPEETYEGSRKIIREGHVMADKLEKESGFAMGHGEAVLRGIKHDLENEENKTRLEKFNRLCEKLRKSV